MSADQNSRIHFLTGTPDPSLSIYKPFHFGSNDDLDETKSPCSFPNECQVRIYRAYFGVIHKTMWSKFLVFLTPSPFGGHLPDPSPSTVFIRCHQIFLGGSSEENETCGVVDLRSSDALSRETKYVNAQ